MVSEIVLLIGARRIETKAPYANLDKRHQVWTANSGKRAQRLVQDEKPHLVILDAASMRTTGERICRQLRVKLGAVPIIHIVPAAQPDCDSLADLVMVAPVPPRKLLHHLDRLLHARNDAVLTCGPFSMNLSSRILTAHGQEIPLTPKLATLVETFLRHPGETLERKMLMKKVWNTQYMGDTRTLDVHIRWIRKALEHGKGKPRYLKTVRGVGYRLELPGERR